MAKHGEGAQAQGKAARRGADNTPVSALDAHLGFWLRLVSNHVSASFEAKTEANGVSLSEWVALRHLFGRDAAGAAELIDALGMTKGAVSKILARLEEKGLVQRQAAARDQRAQHLCLTARGQALVPVLAALADDNDAAYFDSLTARQRNDLLAAMKKIARIHGLKAVPVS